MSRPRRRILMTALYFAIACGLLGMNAVASAQGLPRQIEVNTTEDFTDSLEVQVTLAGLDDFDGGTAAVYMCANADAAGNAITPTAADCIAPGSDGYVFGPIEGGMFETMYTLRLADIGVNGSQCLLLENAPSCQMVVATTVGGDAKITGVPLDELLVQLSTEQIIEAGQLPGRPPADTEVLGIQIEELAETGLSDDLTLILLAASGVFLYLGYLCWSAAFPPADRYVPAHARV